MIDAKRLLAEGLINLQEAARRIPSSRGFGCVSTNTLKRWILKGEGGVKLEALRAGRSFRTSWPAIVRYFEATSAAADEPTMSRREEIEAADRSCAEALR